LVSLTLAEPSMVLRPSPNRPLKLPGERRRVIDPR
jgi:hypothetical protein